jgi:hypothetical protein
MAKHRSDGNGLYTFEKFAVANSRDKMRNILPILIRS